jgi:hypothetical protein
MKPKYKIAIIVVILCVASIGFYKIVFSSFSIGWNISGIDNFLKTQIPTEAQNIQFSGRTDRGGHLDLSFDVPPTDIDGFLTEICQGIVYRAYDPFNSVNIAEPFTYAHLMTIGGHSYYSYSVGTQDTVFGNRCDIAGGAGEFDIKINKTNPHLYHLQLLAYFDGVSYYDPPLHLVTPILELPIEFYGINRFDNVYWMIGDEICVGVQSRAFSFADRDKAWIDIVGASIEVRIDGSSVASAEVVEEPPGDGSLVNRRDANNNPIAIADSGNTWTYCFKVPNGNRLYNMTIQVKTNSNLVYDYNWAFFGNIYF